MSVKAGEQDVQRDLVRGLLPVGPFHQSDHAVEEGLSRLGGDPDDDLVGQHPSAPGDGRPVAARLADHGRGLAGDGRLVDAGDAVDDLAVTGDELTGVDDAHVADVELGTGNCSSVPSSRRTMATVSERASRSESACALPRPSAIASAKLAKSTVNQSQTATSPAKTFSGRGRREVTEEDERGTARCRPRRRTSPGSSPSPGSSLTNASLIAGPTICGSKQRSLCVARIAGATRAGGDVCESVVHGRVRSDGPAARRSGRGRGRGSTSGRRRSARRRRAGRRRAACRSGRCPPMAGIGLLAGQRARDGQRRHDEEEAADQHGQSRRVVLYQSVLPVRPPKADPLLLAADVKA